MKFLQGRYRTAGPDIIFEEFDGDLVVLNLASGQYFGFNASAAAVWTAITSGVSPADIAEVGPVEEAVAEFTKKLLALKLIIADPNTDSSLILGEAEIAALASDRSVPAIEVYDDLADLIVADPIHDVDEATGWPHLPTKD